MKKQLLELLICPSCLPSEFELKAEIFTEEREDIISASLTCPACATQYPIKDGVVFLAPQQSGPLETENKYETKEVVSSYLWSHYSELLDDPNGSEAYDVWSRQIRPHSGVGLDIGAAVGRFTFELSEICDLAIGVDNSVAFIKTARELMQKRQMTFALKEEGFLTREVTMNLPERWRSDKVEFIVADAMALPFRANTVSSSSSLNLIDKVPSPITHLEEINRLSRESNAQILLSDPFSWSEEAAEHTQWLGGQKEGPFSGRGLDNIKELFLGGVGKLSPEWQMDDSGKVWWKIRTHTNHYEMIQSCFIKISR